MLPTAQTTDAANALFQAQRTGQPDALPNAESRDRVAAFFARNRTACDYTNHLAAQAAADPQGAARVEAERQENEIGNAHYNR